MKDFNFPNEPVKITKDHFEDILSHMDNVEASDIYIHSGERILMDIHGNKVDVTKNPTTFNTVEGFAKLIAGDNAIARLNSSEAIDKEFERKKEGKRYRYRVNLTNTKFNAQSAIQITIRAIPVDPPKLNTIGLTNEHPIYKGFFPKQGMVLVTGPTGSGKSTLMASCLAENISEPDCNRIYNTYESPIEFVYDNIKKQSARVFQTSVPDGIKTFQRGLENSLRRKPEVIVVGELRDPETITAAIDAGMTGHLVIGTAHTNGVPATVRRLITVFPANERDGRQADILDQLHMVVAQKLLRTVDGKRVAVRETFIFEPKIKDYLLGIDPLKINLTIRKIMNDKKIGMIFEAKKFLDKGIISEHEFRLLAGSFSSEED
jgi:defect-in-organelle-trafficking protein DotB